MLVVKHSFKNYGKMLLAGSVITEPANVKHLKSRIADHDIVEVTEHNYDMYKDYFLARCHVELPALNASEEPKAKPEEVKAEVAKPETKAVKAVAKPKATAKATTTAKVVTKTE